MIKLQCPTCGKRLTVNDSAKGKKITCPHCETNLLVDHNLQPSNKDVVCDSDVEEKNTDLFELAKEESRLDNFIAQETVPNPIRTTKHFQKEVSPRMPTESILNKNLGCLGCLIPALMVVCAFMFMIHPDGKSEIIKEEPFRFPKDSEVREPQVQVPSNKLSVPSAELPPDLAEGIKAVTDFENLLFRASPKAKDVIRNVDISSKDSHLIIYVRDSFYVPDNPERQQFRKEVINSIRELWSQTNHARKHNAALHIEVVRDDFTKEIFR